MAEGNGAPVMWRELNLLRENFDARFDTIEAKLDDLKEARRDSSARLLSYFAIFAALVGDVGAIIWLTH